MAAHSGSTGTQSVNVDGLESLTVDIAASDVTARFGDVDEATLEVTGGRSGSWTLERDGDELVVRSPDRGFGWWFGDNWFKGDETVVLTLPESLDGAGLDADFSLSAGSLGIEGMYGEVDIEMGAGGLNMDGSATSIDAAISAGTIRPRCLTQAVRNASVAAEGIPASAFQEKGNLGVNEL